MDALRDGIGLRGFGQRDPKLEYKREGFDMFQAMLFPDPGSCFPAPHPGARAGYEPGRGRSPRGSRKGGHGREFRHHDDNRSLSYSASGQVETESQNRQKAAPRVGRNDPALRQRQEIQEMLRPGRSVRLK